MCVVVQEIKTKIYCLKDKNQNIRYIGKTIGLLNHRLNQHIHDCKRKGNSHKTAWLKKCIRENYKPTIHLIMEIEGDGCQEEILLIALTKQLGINLVNSTEGGEGTLGRKDSVETRQRKKEASSKKRHTEETKKLISRINSGSNNRMYGKKRKKQSLDKQREKLIQKANPFICNETGKIYYIIMDACKELNIDHSCVSRCLRKDRGTKSVHGYTFEYI